MSFFSFSYTTLPVLLPLVFLVFPVIYPVASFLASVPGTVASMDQAARETKEKTAKQDVYSVNFTKNMNSVEESVNAFTSVFRRRLVELFQVEETRKKLKKGAKSKENLVDWVQWQTSAVARVVTGCYGVVVTRHLALLVNAVYGRYVIEDSKAERNGLQELQMNYKPFLFLCEKWFAEGMEALAKNVDDAVKEVLKNYGLEMALTTEIFERLMFEIKQKVENGNAFGNIFGPRSFIDILFGQISNDPDGQIAIASSTRLNEMFAETRAILESESVRSLFNRSFDECYANMVISFKVTPFMAQLVPHFEKSAIVLFEEPNVSNLLSQNIKNEIRNICGIIYFPLERSLGVKWTPVPVVQSQGTDRFAELPVDANPFLSMPPEQMAAMYQSLTALPPIR